jgi:hypothetical protein
MLFGETVAVYCVNHTEHKDTVRTSQEPYGTHRYSPYLTGNTLRLVRNTQTRYLCEQSEVSTVYGATIGCVKRQ